MAPTRENEIVMIVDWLTVISKYSLRIGSAIFVEPFAKEVASVPRPTITSNTATSPIFFLFLSFRDLRRERIRHPPHGMLHPGDSSRPPSGTVFYIRIITDRHILRFTARGRAPESSIRPRRTAFRSGAPPWPPAMRCRTVPAPRREPISLPAPAGWKRWPPHREYTAG